MTLAKENPHLLMTITVYLECCAEGPGRAVVLARDVLEVIVNDLLRNRGFGKFFESNMANVDVTTSFGHKFPFPPKRVI